MSSEVVAKPEEGRADAAHHRVARDAAYEPIVPALQTFPELTPIPLAVGVLLGMVFGASSLYLVLKVGLTVSASIPVAVISISFFRLISRLGFRNTNILENNIVQTVGSSGESIAFGLGVTMPALLLLGFDLTHMRVWLVALIGGLLGGLLIILLRRALIVEKHGVLKYPEGVACAEILKAGASDERSDRFASSVVSERESAGSKVVFLGFGIGFAYQVAMSVLKCWKEVPEKVFGPPLRSASIGAEVSPVLTGVGYIIGPRIAAILCAGGVMSYLVLIPLISYFGGWATTPLSPGKRPVGEMSPYEIRNAYILYIGAGAVVTGGIISLFRSVPILAYGARAVLSDLRGGSADSATLSRTDRDLPVRFIIPAVIALFVTALLVPALNMNLVGALIMLALGFLFVTVSARLTGEIGSSSNPISGMALATLLLTCLALLGGGWKSPSYYVTALVVGAVVCTAASSAGTGSQVLKTGFLVGATPWRQQAAILIGILISAIILGPVLIRLNSASTVCVPSTTYEPLSRNIGRLDPNVVRGLEPLVPANVPGMPHGTYRLLDYKPAAGGIIVAGLERGNYLVTEGGEVAFVVRENFPEELPKSVDVRQLERQTLPCSGQESAAGPYYAYWHESGGKSSKYLVDEKGMPVYLIDPGINGERAFGPDGRTVEKFHAPKSVLMAYVIKGILEGSLPWGLVLMGVMLAIVLEMVGIPSLAFAVGVYLPLSSSTPILAGGLVRWLVDWKLADRYRRLQLSDEEIIAEGDRSPGVLMASGYIAGAAIAGIITAFFYLGGARLMGVTRSLEDWATAFNPFYNGPYADLLALIPFSLLCLLLYAVGRELWLVGRPMASKRPKRSRTTS